MNLLEVFKEARQDALIGISLIYIAIGLFFLVVFGQSSLDKIIDRKGNKDYFSEYFKNTFFKGYTSLLLTTITILELSIAVLSLVLTTTAIYNLFVLALGNQIPNMSLPSKTAIYLSFLGCITISCLILGQRIAKDYLSSARTVPYFIAALISLIFSVLLHKIVSPF